MCDRTMLMLLLLSWLTIVHGKGASQDQKYKKTNICLSSECNFLETSPRMRSRIECMSACAHDVLCRGTAFNGSCFHLNDACFFSSACDQQPLYMPVYEKQACKHEGEWNSTVGQCRCYGGWIGPTCEEIGKSCSELQQEGYPPGFYSVRLLIQDGPLAEPQNVICSVSQDKSVLTYIFRSTGKEEHNRTWDDYVKGYHINNGNLWLGLDNMAALSATSGYSEVAFSAILESDSEHRVFTLFYTDLKFGDSSNQYRYTVTSPPTYATDGNLGAAYDLDDVFGLSKDIPFSTADEDNDSDGINNCAALAGSGWWFTTCDTWAETGTDKVNPLGWTTEARPADKSGDFRNVMALPGLDFEDAELTGTFMVTNVYFYHAPPP